MAECAHLVEMAKRAEAAEQRVAVLEEALRGLVEAVLETVDDDPMDAAIIAARRALEVEP